MHRIALTFFSLALATPAAAGVPLWQKSETGMSPDEIAAIYPDATPPIKQETLNSGAKCKLALPHYDVDGRDFSVCFYFKDSGLDQVTLKAADPNEPLFDTIVELLRAKYGPELGAGNPACERGILTLCKASWALATGANISTIYLRVGRETPAININYQTRLAGEASKL